LEIGSDEYLPFFYDVFSGARPAAPSTEEQLESLYPILRNFEPDDSFVQSVVNMPVCDNLAIFAGRRIVSPSGNQAIDYVLKADLPDYDLSEEQLLQVCYDNFFAASIEVQAYEQHGDQLFELASSEGLVSAIIGHETTYDRLAQLMKTTEIAIAIPDPHSLLATKIGSSFEPGFHEIIQHVQHDAGALHLIPAVFHWKDKAKLVLVPSGT
jgi:hypothetical protein